MSGPIVTGAKLAAIAGVCAAIVGLGVAVTREPIRERLAEQRAEALAGLIDPQGYDNDAWGDALRLERAPLLGYPDGVEIARLRKGDEPVASVIPVRAADGYAGPIELLVAVSPAGAVLAVMIVEHRETPGIGDVIEPQRSDWLRQFDSRSLASVPPVRWRVTRLSGGAEPAFDAASGATITSQAVVKGIRDALLFHGQHADRLVTQDD